MLVFLIAAALLFGGFQMGTKASGWPREDAPVTAYRLVQSRAAGLLESRSCLAGQGTAVNGAARRQYVPQTHVVGLPGGLARLYVSVV